MKPRELTAALVAVVGASCVVAFAVVYSYSPDLQLGPVVAKHAKALAPHTLETFGPPDPPPQVTAPIVFDRKKEENEADKKSADGRWHPDAPAAASSHNVSRSTKKSARRSKKVVEQKEISRRQPEVLVTQAPADVVDADTHFETLVAAPSIENAPVVAPPLLTAAPLEVDEEAVAEAEADAAPAALVTLAETAPPVVPTPFLVEPPATPEVAAAELELAGGADVVDAIATNALALVEDDGAVSMLTAAEIEAESLLAANDAVGGYPGAADAGTILPDANKEATVLTAVLAAPEIQLPEEVDTIPSVATIQATDYTAVRENLLALTAKVEQLPTVRAFVYEPPAPVAPEKLTVDASKPELKPEPALVAATAPARPEPELVAPKPQIREALQAKEEEASEGEEDSGPVVVRTTESETNRAEAKALDAAVRSQVTKDVAALDTIVDAPKLVAQATRPRALAGAVPLVTQASAPRSARVLDARQEFANIQTAKDAGGTTIAEAEGIRPSMEASEEFAARAERQMIEGDLYPGKQLNNWLKSKHGHIELYLQPEGTRDPSDTIYVDYSYPNRRFKIERTGLVGRYRLIAGIFSPGSPAAVAQIPFKKLLSEENYKELVRFEMEDTAFETALAGTAAGVAKSVSLHLSLYAAGTSNYQGKGADGDGSFRQPTPIQNATVRIVNAADVPPGRSDAEGNARFSRVPSRSDLEVEVTAPGFMKTYAVVPVWDTPAYQPIYLIAKNKVETVTSYFTRRPQQNGRAVVMGRVFDKTKRRPEAGQRLRLQNRKGPALYFGALPDTELQQTTANGLFGFFNVAPSFRSIAREARDAIPFLMHLRPNTGTYVELGRGGAKTLSGKLYDPFTKKAVTGLVRLVGTETVKVETDDEGLFQLEGIEAPPGVLTLEIDADGYPLTWINVSWSPRDGDKMRTIFLVDDDTVAQGMRDFSKVSPKANRGSLVGGAESQLFQKTQGCLNVTLESLENGPAKPLQGPHALLHSQAGQPLCVSAQTPAFAFHDLPAGEWYLRWADLQGHTLRTRLVRVGQGRVTVVVN